MSRWKGTADGWEAYEDVLAGQPTDDITAEVDDDDTTILMFTAGTTGLPKGVMLTFGGVSSYSLSKRDASGARPSRKEHPDRSAVPRGRDAGRYLRDIRDAYTSHPAPV